ncbi:MAG: hypothetical protein AAGH81_01000 [Bacteroidota bacterium]
MLLVKSSTGAINVSNESPNDYSRILGNQGIRNPLGMKLDFIQDVIDYGEELDNAIKELTMPIASKLKDEGLQ